MRLILIVPVLLLFPAMGLAQDWYVDDDAPNDPGPNDSTISDPAEDGTSDHPFDMVQEALNAAATTGHTILVRAGTYLENIDFLGKAVVLQSESGAASTIIDGVGSNWMVVTFSTSEGLDSVLDGFTITNGYAPAPYNNEQYGAGITCDGTSPTIRNNIITGNVAEYAGGGIACRNSSSPLITNNTITSNSVSLHTGGGGIYTEYSSPTISNNTISYNTAVGSGGGVCAKNDSYPVVKDNIIIHNTASSGAGIQFSTRNWPVALNNIVMYNGTGGIACGSNGYTYYKIIGCVVAENDGTGISINKGENQSKPVITNCTVVDNQGTGISANGCQITNTIVWGNTGSQIFYDSWGGPSAVNNCDVQGGYPYGFYNINVDPEFVDPDNDDYHLTSSSACCNWGDNSAPYLYLVTTDFEGDPRIWEPSGSPRVDVGADEYVDPLLVELVFFKARGYGSTVLLYWETAAEIDTAGFHVWRSMEPYPQQNEFLRITGQLIPARGGSTNGYRYYYFDRGMVQGYPYWYRLEDIDNNGSSTFHDPVQVGWGMPVAGRK